MGEEKVGELNSADHRFLQPQNHHEIEFSYKLPNFDPQQAVSTSGFPCAVI